MTMEAGNGSTPTNGDNKPEGEGPPQEQKLKYDRIELCSKGCEKHCTVYFTNGGQEFVEEFTDIERVCELMDDDSVSLFRGDIGFRQKEGKLGDLLPPNARADRRAERQAKLEEEAWRLKAKQRELLEREKDLNDQMLRVEIAGRSNLALANTVTSHLVKGLDKDGLNALFIEMSDREMVVKIVVVADINSDETNFIDGRTVLETVLDPQDLVREEMTDAWSGLEAADKDLQNEAKQYRDDMNQHLLNTLK